MTESYTSDVPAVPDPDYVSLEDNLPSYLIELRQDLDRRAERLSYRSDENNDNAPLIPDYYPQRYFEWSNAQKFIDNVADYDDDGRLNIDAKSLRIGIPYSYDMRSDLMIRGEIVGLPGSLIEEPIEIHLRKEDKQDHRIIFGHEIGHYFFRLVMQESVDGYSASEEKFCTYFGAMMAMPRLYLEAYETIDKEALLDIMSRFKVGPEDAISQLMEYGLLPTRVAIDTYIGKVKNPDFSERVNRHFVCKHCSATGGDYNCPHIGTNTLLFDFTDRAWSEKMRVSCLGERLHKPEIVSNLTKHYAARETQLLLFRPGARFEYDAETDANALS